MTLVQQLVKKGILDKEKASSLEFEVNNSGRREEEVILEKGIISESFLFGLKSENLRRTTNMISGASRGRRPFNRLPYGTLQVSVNSTPKFHQLMGLIEGVKAKLVVI